MLSFSEHLVYVCLFFICTISISIVYVLQEEPSLIASNQQIYDFNMWIFFKRKAIVESKLWISVNYSFNVCNKSSCCSGFNLSGRDLWFEIRFWVFTSEFFIITSLFTTRKKGKNHGNYRWTYDIWIIWKFILTLWTLKYVDCFPFSCIDLFHN